MILVDLLEESAAGIDADGISLVRVYTVTGVSGSADQRLYNALFAAGVPRYGDAHPAIPGIRMLDLRAEPLSSGQYKVLATYRAARDSSDEPPSETSAPQISVGSVVVDTQTSKDKDGNQLTVSITITDVDASGNTVITEEEQTGEVSIAAPQSTIRFSRREPVSPFLKSITYTGHVNSRSIWGGGPRTWLCRGIEGQSSDGGLSFEVEYEFQYAPQTWDATVGYIDEETGKLHEDVDIATGNGLATFRVYPEADFDRLNLPL